MDNGGYSDSGRGKRSCPILLKPSVKAAILYSSGLRNSTPKSRISPAESWRRTLAVMGGVSLGTTPEEAEEGAGMVRCTI